MKPRMTYFIILNSLMVYVKNTAAIIRKRSVMKIASAVLFGHLLFSFSYAQQTWMRTYGGTGWDYGYAVQQTSDGGYIIVGRTSSFGAGVEDVYLIKTNIFGDTLWTRTYGGTGSDVGFAVQQTTDAGYIITGHTAYGSTYYVYLIKTNASGDTLWTRTYDAYARGQSVQQTSDGGYIIVGHTYSHGAGWDDVYLIKTNASGDTLWTRTYGGTSYDCGYSVQQTSDGGYIIAGRTWSFGTGEYDVYLIKTNASGDTLWTRTYGGTSWDEGYSVQKTSDGGYIITGYTYVESPNYQDVYLIKTNASGDTIWTRTYGGAGGDLGNSVKQTTDGGYIIAGHSGSFGAGEYDVYLIKTNASGDTLWTRTYGGGARDEGHSVQQTSDGGYIITGLTESFGAGNYDVYLIKTDSDGNIGVEEKSSGRFYPLTANFSLTVVPNPFTSFATVAGRETEWFVLYDITGRQVGAYKGDKVGKGLSPGVYFLQAKEKDTMPVQLVKIH
ncbi:MAG: hypothetical protein WBB67_13805 [bacterium]